MLLILTGPVHSGKTSRLKGFVEEWRARGMAVDGYLSPAVFSSERRLGYDWLDLRTGESAPFLRRTGEEGWEKVGPFFLVPSTLEKAREKILFCDPHSLLIVDEAGPLEIQGGGVWPALVRALAEPSRRILVVVRETILREFRRISPVPPRSEFSIEDRDLGRSLFSAVRPSRLTEKA